MTDDPPRTIADQWAKFRRTLLHHYADDAPQIAQAHAIFYAGAYGFHRVFCALMDAAETSEQVQEGADRLVDELKLWAKLHTGEINLQ